MKLSHVFLLSACLFSFQAQAMEAIDETRPNEHLCPITLQVMKDPVVAADGHSYERSAISGHFKNQNPPISPLTGAPFNNKDLFENHALKTMISEWKPGKQSKPSVLETRSAENIAQRVKEEFSKNAVLLNSAKNQHIVAFLGNTGAGKSTLVNLLGGKKLVVSSDGEDYVLDDPDDKTAMVIGAGGDSETLYPKFIDVDGLRFFDLPGFNDTDGSERNLVNAAFIRKILLDAASVRLVLVVGQDQFTADRSTSVRQMFNKLQQLFVIGQGGGLIDNSSVFVATKVTCPLDTEITEFLVKKTNSHDKVGLRDQLKYWTMKNRLACMFHPLRDENNKGVRQQILELIKDTETAEVRGMNVSVLYPSDTQRDLERMFLQVFENAFDRKVNRPLSTLSDYDGAITYYISKDFWKTFDVEVCGEEDSIGLLKEFCINPYKTALKNLEKENEGKRQTHIEDLRKKRQARIKDIEQRTEKRANEVIKILVPKKENDSFVSFDFAYHRDFYDQVCGRVTITELATDLPEQEIVRRHYAGFISQHSHKQMMDWHQKFSGTNDLIKQMARMEERLKILEAERAEKNQRIMQEAEQREKEECEKLERERLRRERLECAKLEREIVQREKLERENLEQERLQREKLEQQMEREKQEREKKEKERLRQAAEERERKAEERRAEERRAEERRAEERRAEERRGVCPQCRKTGVLSTVTGLCGDCHGVWHAKRRALGW